MKVFQKDWNRKGNVFLPLFVTSAATVWMIIMMQGRDLLLQTEVLDENALALIKYRVQDCRSLFFYVLKERCLIIPAVFLMSTTYLAMFFIYGVVIWYGVSAGAILGIAMLRYGISGVFLILTSCLPQYLLYVPAMVVALRLSQGQRQPTRKFLIQLFVLEVVVIIGCVLESYVNLMIVEKMIKIFITG